MWNAGAVLTIGISALSPWMYIARNAAHLFSPCLSTLNIHEAMPIGQLFTCLLYARELSQRGEGTPADKRLCLLCSHQWE